MIPIVIFDGISGSGKTTLRYALYQKLEGNVLTIDRFTPSVWVYDYLRGFDRVEEIGIIEKKFDDAFSPLLVLCTCSERIAAERVRNNQFREIQFLVNDELLAFAAYLERVCQYSRILTTVDTSDVSINESLERILCAI